MIGKLTTGEITMTFQFSQSELEVLHTIFRNIGGKPDGPRKVADDFSKALYDAGVKHSSKGATDSICFSSWDTFREGLGILEEY